MMQVQHSSAEQLPGSDLQAYEIDGWPFGPAAPPVVASQYSPPTSQLLFPQVKVELLELPDWFAAQTPGTSSFWLLEFESPQPIQRSAASAAASSVA